MVLTGLKKFIVRIASSRSSTNEASPDIGAGNEPSQRMRAQTGAGRDVDRGWIGAGYDRRSALTGRLTGSGELFR